MKSKYPKVIFCFSWTLLRLLEVIIRNIEDVKWGRFNTDAFFVLSKVLREQKQQSSFAG